MADLLSLKKQKGEIYMTISELYNKIDKATMIFIENKTRELYYGKLADMPMCYLRAEVVRIIPEHTARENYLVVEIK